MCIVRQISEKSRKKSRCQLIIDICRLSASRMLVASLIWSLQRYCSAANAITMITAGITTAVDVARHRTGIFIKYLAVRVRDTPSRSGALSVNAFYFIRQQAALLLPFEVASENGPVPKARSVARQSQRVARKAGSAS